jgi:ketosteroid isomerase-like protein
MSIPAPTDSTDVAELQQLEAARYTAMTDRDISTLDRLFDDRLTYIHSSGDRETKDEYLRALRASVYEYGPIEHSQSDFVVAGDVAVVHGEMRAEARVNGAVKFLGSVATSVWIRSDSTWRLLNFQTTTLPAE